MSSSNCCFLTCIQVSQEAGQVVWYSHLFQNFPVYCHPHSQRFGTVNKAEIDVFLEHSWFFNDPVDVGNLISVSSAFSKSSLNIWKFTFHILLKPCLENFEYEFTSVWDECNCVVVWAFSGIAFLWDWNSNWPFPVLWPVVGRTNFSVIHWATKSNLSFQLLKILKKNVEKMWLLMHYEQRSESEVAQSCPTPSDPMDCSPPGFFVHGILQARVLEWGAIAFSNEQRRSDRKGRIAITQS